jgi:hypothetical protein
MTTQPGNRYYLSITTPGHVSRGMNALIKTQTGYVPLMEASERKILLPMTREKDNQSLKC